MWFALIPAVLLIAWLVYSARIQARKRAVVIDAFLAAYARFSDVDSLGEADMMADVHAMRSTAFRVLGMRERAWRHEAYEIAASWRRNELVTGEASAPNATAILGAHAATLPHRGRREMAMRLAKLDLTKLRGVAGPEKPDLPP